MTIPTDLFPELKAAAELLQKPGLGDLVTAVERHTEGSHTRLLILGEADGRHLSVANTLLQENLLPRSLLPAKSFSMHLDHNSRSLIELRETNGVTSVVSPTALADHLFQQAHQEVATSEARDLAGTAQLHYHSPNRLLEAITVSLEDMNCLPEADMDRWTQLLCEADYVLIVLRATAILSQAEKKFIRERMMPVMGTGRFALVIDQMEALTAVERDEITRYVRAYFDGEQAAPPLLLHDSQRANNDQGLTSSWHQEIRGHVQHEVLGKHSSLRSAALVGGLQASIRSIESAARQTLQDMETHAARLELLRKSTDAQIKRLGERSAEFKNRLELHLDTFLRERTLRDIESFGGAIRTQLPREIGEAGANPQTLHALPQYLETLWAEYLEQILPELRAEILKTVKPIADDVVREVTSVAGSHSVDENILISELVLTTSGTVPVSVPRAKTNSDGFQGLSQVLSGALSVLSGGQRPAGDTAAGSAPQKLAQELAQAAMPAAREIEQQIKTETSRRFSELTAQYAQAIGNFYRQAEDHLQANARQEQEKNDLLLSHRADIESLLSERIPGWRSQVGTAGINP